MSFLPEVKRFFSKKIGQRRRGEENHSRDTRPGRLQTIVAQALSGADREGSVSCQEDELGAKGGCQAQ